MLELWKIVVERIKSKMKEKVRSVEMVTVWDGRCVWHVGLKSVK